MARRDRPASPLEPPPHPVGGGFAMFRPGLSVPAATIRALCTRVLGGTMRRRTTTLLAVCLLALAGCSSDGEPEKETVTVTATTSTPAATPSLSLAETERLCSVAVSEAAPGWEDWNFDFGAWQEDPRTPEVCLGLADEEVPSRGNRAFMGALLAGLELADDPRANQ